jgi:hypothetical protein
MTPLKQFNSNKGKRNYHLFQYVLVGILPLKICQGEPVFLGGIQYFAFRIGLVALLLHGHHLCFTSTFYPNYAN